MSENVCIFITKNGKNNVKLQRKIKIFARNRTIYFNCVKKAQNSKEIYLVKNFCKCLIK
jgi:hypothetical protein